MAARALDFLLLSAYFAVNIEKGRLATMHAEYMQRLAARGALVVVFLHLRFAVRASDVDRRLFAAVGAYHVFGCN